ncbi:hypothetical protein ABT369_55170 [Dactylosporangium sp. NPDC000244]|uniref:hypothetical protein n=1 Tax=Dactylosporangium sp. NPDC000244 TaxID=3154365 RepID=UPI00331C0657
MRKRGIVAALLAAVLLACAGLHGFITQLRVQNLRHIGEVTEVVEGARPGTVLVRTERSGRGAWWVVDDRGEPVDAADERQVHSGAMEEGCAAGTCYRVWRGELKVQRSDNGGSGEYRTVWEIAGPAYTVLADGYPGLGDRAEHLASRSIVAHEVPGGHVLFVANGRDGLLFRDAGNAWHRLGAPDSGEGCCFYTPVPRLSTEPAPFDPTWPAAALAAAVVLVSGLLSRPRSRAGTATVVLVPGLPSRPRSRAGTATVLFLATAAAYGAALAVNLPDAGMVPGLLCGTVWALAIVAAGCVLARRLPARLREPAPPGSHGAESVAP